VLGNLLTAKIKPNVEQKLETMLFALLILAFMSILQTILGNRLGSFVTLPLGDFSYEYQYNADINSSITRASALYAEPSFNALICLSFLPLVLSIRDRKKRIVYSFITSAYMVSTFSLTGILSLGLILLVWSWEGRKIRIFPVLSLAGLFLITSNYVYDRWQSIGMIGSSANYRIIAPFKAIVEVIPENLFGIPLGSLEITMRKFEFLNGDRIGTSVDNGFLLIVLYFGLMGVMAVISIFAFTIRKAIAMQRKKMHGWPMVLVPCLTLNFNGGIFLPDFLCVLAFVIITIRSNIMRTIETEERL
jgi:putative colanic acid polymerase